MPPPEFVEVRCAGCSETLEVEPGLTEFACPDCGTHQALPPELMPPPPRPRRALPIPDRGPTTAVPVPVRAHMPCGGCGTVLSVPAVLGRFVCPLCGVELVVDGGRLRLHLASQDAATVSVVASPPASATLASPHTRRRQEAQVEIYDHPVRSEEIPAQCPSLSVHREETPSSFRKDTHTTIHSMLAQQGPPDHSVYREESHIESLNTATMSSITRKSRLQAGTESIGVEKVQPEPPIQASFAPHAQARARPPSYSVCSEHAQGRHPVVGIASHGQQRNGVSGTMEQENIDPLNQAVNVEQAQAKYKSKTTGWNPKRKRSSKSTSGNQKRKVKGLTSYPNDGLHLRRSKRFAKQSEHPINYEPAQQSDASPNEYDSDPPDIDGIITNLCPSSLPRHQVPQASSKVSGMHQLDRSGEQVQPQLPEVMHVQQEDAHGGHLLLGSDGKSSGKRRGRPQNRPTRLIEPRREADRPILIPNNIEYFNPLRQFAGILWEEKRRARAELASVHKAKEISGTHISNRHTELNEEDAREEPEDQQRAERSEGDDPLQWKYFSPAWMYPNWWERLCEHWAKEEVLMMSSQNRKNRCAGGHAFHTTGSRSFAMHHQLMVMKNGGELVSELEIFNKTHKLNGGTGEFISERAKRTVEGFKKRMEEAGDKKIDPNLAWAQEVGGRNRRGRSYGLTGIIDKAKVDELAKSSPSCFGKQGQRQMFTQEQVQQMINQALQRLNETWENRFKSLEQSVRGVPLLGVHPEYVPGFCDWRACSG